MASLGSIGLLVAWDVSGTELWRVDLGVLDSGWFLDPTYQWATQLADHLPRFSDLPVGSGSYADTKMTAPGRPACPGARHHPL